MSVKSASSSALDTIGKFILFPLLSYLHKLVKKIGVVKNSLRCSLSGHGISIQLKSDIKPGKPNGFHFIEHLQFSRIKNHSRTHWLYSRPSRFLKALPATNWNMTASPAVLSCKITLKFTNGEDSGPEPSTRAGPFYMAQAPTLGRVEWSCLSQGYQMPSRKTETSISRNLQEYQTVSLKGMLFWVTNQPCTRYFPSKAHCNLVP